MVRESIPQNSQSSEKEMHLNVQTNSPHDPQAWADDEVDEEFVSLDAQEVLGTWEDLLAALQPPAQSATTAAPVLEVAASEEVGTELEAHETTEEPSVVVEQEVSGETVEDDAVSKGRAPDGAIDVEHNGEAVVITWSLASPTVEDVTEASKPSESTIESEFSEICKVEDAVYEIVADIPAQLAATVAVQEKFPESEEAVGPFPYEVSEEASAPSERLALASCET